MSLKETNLGMNAELNQQGIPLTLLQEYQLGACLGTTDTSLHESIFGSQKISTENQIKENQLAGIAQNYKINIVLWFGTGLKLYRGNDTGSYLMIFRNKYIQYFPIVRRNRRLFYAGTEEADGSQSLLLLKLLGRIDNELVEQSI